MEVLTDYIEWVSKKVQAAELENVQVVKRDALDTGLDAESIDTVLLFSVIPSPTLPLRVIQQSNLVGRHLVGIEYEHVAVARRLGDDHPGGFIERVLAVLT